MIHSLEKFPTEVLVNIFSYLEDTDFTSLEKTCQKFKHIINDEELWKNLFIKRLNTQVFPSYSRSMKYSVEYVSRNKALSLWKHNKAIKTKYTISHESQSVNQGLQANNSLQIIFDYPRCACYSEGLITFLQLQSKRRKDRLAYIQCTTPHGCSTFHFNINAVVFGRIDGRIFGKLLTNKSYLSPVSEFDSQHTSCVTAIKTVAFEDSSDNWCVSGSKLGDIIWWCNSKKQSELKVSNNQIINLFIHKNITVVIDTLQIHVISMMKHVNTIDIPSELQNDVGQICFTKIDFGAMLLILADTISVFVISINCNKDFGFTKSIRFLNTIENIILDEVTAKKIHDPLIAGGDGCYMVVLDSLNVIRIINIRAPGYALKIHINLPFDKEVYSCQIDNVVLVVAFSGMVGIYNASTGTEVRVIQNTEQIPQYLNISQGNILVGSFNILHYYQYFSKEHFVTKNKKSGHSRSNKWNDVLNSQLDIFNEDEYNRKIEFHRWKKLKNKYVGDVDDDLQFQIALLESRSLMDSKSYSKIESDLLAPLETSLGTSSTDDYQKSYEDEELLIALEKSKSEAQYSQVYQSRELDCGNNSEANDHVSSFRFSDSMNENYDLQYNKEIDKNLSYKKSTVSLIPENEIDEDLALAIALSLSEMK